MIDIQADSPTIYWTCDSTDDPAYEEVERLHTGDIWAVQPLFDAVLSDTRIAFDYPGEWDASGNFNELLLGEDGCFRSHSTDDTNYEAVKAESHAHVVLTGRWTQDGYGSGPFVAVFPKSSSPPHL